MWAAELRSRVAADGRCVAKASAHVSFYNKGGRERWAAAGPSPMLIPRAVTSIIESSASMFDFYAKPPQALSRGWRPEACSGELEGLGAQGLKRLGAMKINENQRKRHRNEAVLNHDA